MSPDIPGILQPQAASGRASGQQKRKASDAKLPTRDRIDLQKAERAREKWRSMAARDLPPGIAAAMVVPGVASAERPQAMLVEDVSADIEPELYAVVPRLASVGAAASSQLPTQDKSPGSMASKQLEAMDAAREKPLIKEPPALDVGNDTVHVGKPVGGQERASADVANGGKIASISAAANPVAEHLRSVCTPGSKSALLII